MAGSGFTELIYFLGMLSINLAVLNFLPIPPLDGGQMLFLIAEKVRGRPLPESALIAGTYLGLFLVLSLMVFVTYQDVFRSIHRLTPVILSLLFLLLLYFLFFSLYFFFFRVFHGNTSRSTCIGDGRPARLRSNGTPAAEVVARLAGSRFTCRLDRHGRAHSRRRDRRPGADRAGRCRVDGPDPDPDQAANPAIFQSLKEPAWVAVFPSAPHRSRLTLAAGLLQVHDFWDASHDAAQRADDMGEREFSAYWHGIAHRREPDAGNAAYWFRRVGKHQNFKPLAEEARPLLDHHGDQTLSARLISGGAWNASAMIDLCTSAKPGSPNEAIARRLQRIEMWLLLEATFAAL